MAGMNSPALLIQDLSFHYPGQDPEFISHLNLTVPDGQRFGLFGPNGAGKTTLMNLATGLVSQKGGQIRLLDQELGRHARSIRGLFGYVPQELSFYHELSPAENLAFFGAWAGMRPLEIRRQSAVLLETLGLNDLSRRPIRQGSGGMKRRLNLAIGVINRPRLLFLDEPTEGVDVQSRRAILDFLIELNRQGTTLVYTSHQLAEAEGLCETIALMDRGRIIAHDSLSQLLQLHAQEGLEGLFLNLTGKQFRD
jgi:ABC-2 type transport system ATP-binding protein